MHIETQALKPQRKWQRRKTARRGEILEAATKVFAEKGYDRTRMADIAEQAGITKGTIYLYFTNKEDVFRAITVEEAEMSSAAPIHSLETIWPQLRPAALETAG